MGEHVADALGVFRQDMAVDAQRHGRIGLAEAGYYDVDWDSRQQTGESNVPTLLNTSARRTNGCGVCPCRCGFGCASCNMLASAATELAATSSGLMQARDGIAAQAW